MSSANPVLAGAPDDRRLRRSDEWVLRFGRTERLLHWWTVAMVATALLTGLGVGDDGWGLVLTAHVAAVALVGAGVLAAVVVGDRAALLQAARALFVFDQRDAAWLRELGRRPLHYPSGAGCGMFNPGQKLLAWALPFVGTAVVVTGVSAAMDGGLGRRHGLVVATALALLAAHVFMAVLNPATRHALHGMVFGRVRRSWAADHHGAWLEGMDERR